jgi:hypothetical protein
MLIAGACALQAFLTAAFNAGVRAPSLLSPSLVKYGSAQLFSIDAASVTWHIGQKPVCPWELGGLHLGKR